MLQDEVLSINPKLYQEIYLLIAVLPHRPTSLLPNTFPSISVFLPSTAEGLPEAFPQSNSAEQS